MNPLEFKATARESEYDPRTYVHDMATSTVYTTGGKSYEPSDIENQWAEGICTAISLVQNAEKAVGKKYSPDFQYLLQKKYFDMDWQEGSSIFSSLKAARKYGLLPLEKFTDSQGTPYIIESDRLLQYQKYIEKLQTIPDAEIQRLLGLCEKKITGYAMVDVSTKENIAHAIESSASGILCRYTVTTRWWSPSWNEKDISPLQGDGNVVGGHAISAISYDYVTNTFQKLANTWGTLWCDKGKIDVDYSKYKMTEAWIPYYDATPSVQPKFTQYLKLGSTGNEVKMLQKVLNVTPQSGYFGKLTEAAVKAFQKQNGLPQTGTVGPLTRAKLNNGVLSAISLQTNMKEVYQEYLKSALISFVAGFCLAILPDIDKLTLASFHDGAFIGLVFVGVRTGFKAVIELFLSLYQMYKDNQA
jgi:hypothetical protein